MSLTTPEHQSSSKPVSRKIPLDIDFATQKIGKGAFARTCALVFSQLKYWWKYSKHQYDGKYWFFKSQKSLGIELGMSEKTIYRAIKRLRELGLIEVKKHHQHYWKQVYFYSLLYFPHPNSADGASSPKASSKSFENSKGASTQKVSPAPSSQNGGVKRTRRNPLEEIIRRANQKQQQGKGFSGAFNASCKKCRGSGLVDNPKNVAIRCECDAGSRYSHILPIIGDVDLLPSPA